MRLVLVFRHPIVFGSAVVDEVTSPRVVATKGARYGNPLNVYRTIKQLIAAGAAGCFLEDQLWPKRCGHMRGKQVIDRGEYIRKIRAAVKARGDADFFIVARTDALAVKGMDEAIAWAECR